MAIVFDTKAELEAFCEAFELRSIPQEKPSRKFGRRLIRSERMTERHQAAQSNIENYPQLEIAPVTQISEVEVSSLSDLTTETPVLASAS